MIPLWIFRACLAICLWYFQAVIILGSLVVIIWMSLIPKCPVSTISNVYTPALDGWNSTAFRKNESVPAPPHKNDSAWNISIIFSLQITKPNKGIGIYYSDLYFTLYNSNASLGVNCLPAFYQGHKKTVTFHVLVNVDQQFWRGIIVRKRDLRVGLKTVIRYEIFSFKTKHRSVAFEAQVPIGSDGRILGGEYTELHR